MNIQIYSEGIELSDSMRFIIDEKLAKPLEKYLTHLADDQKNAQLHITKDGPEIFKVNFTMNNLYSESRHILLESAIVDLREQLEIQIKKIEHK